VAWSVPGVGRQGSPGEGLLKRDASGAILELGITARSRPAVPHPRAQPASPVGPLRPLPPGRRLRWVWAPALQRGRL